MRKSYKFKKRTKPEKKYAYNEMIKAPELMVVDENGENLGQLETREAMRIANERGFDLVEVSPNAKPPVAKFMDYGSFKYQIDKLQKKQEKQGKTLSVKNIRISIKMGDHDKETRIKQAVKFLEKGHKIKVELILKGREMQHLGLAKDILRKFKDELEFPTQVEQDISKQGNKLFLILMPEKQQ